MPAPCFITTYLKDQVCSILGCKNVEDIKQWYVPGGKGLHPFEGKGDPFFVLDRCLELFSGQFHITYGKRAGDRSAFYLYFLGVRQL